MRQSVKRLAVIALTAVVTAPTLALSVKTAVDDSDSYECSAIPLGQTSSATRDSFKAFPLCLMRVSCTTTVAIRDANLPARTNLSWLVPCKPTETGCPSKDDYKSCVHASLAKGRDFGTADAVVAADSSEEHKKNVCTYSKDTADQERANFIVRKVGDAVDRVCVGAVSCKPGLDEPVAVCVPKLSSASSVTCPSASTCVAGRFPIEKPKVEIVARPHGGAPAQSVSNGSTHVQSDQKR